MRSFGSVLIAQWFLAPTTLMWCRLLLNNPAERMIQAWSHAMLQQATFGTFGRVEVRRSQTEATEQGHHRGDMLARVAACEDTAIVELASYRPKARASVGDEVSYDGCKILLMPVGLVRDRRP
jgi:hypothetical protein